MSELLMIKKKFIIWKSKINTRVDHVLDMVHDIIPKFLGTRG